MLSWTTWLSLQARPQTKFWPIVEHRPLERALRYIAKTGSEALPHIV